MKKRAELNQDRLLDLTQEATNPFYVVLSPTGEVLDKIGGYNEPRVFTEFLNKALEKFPETVKVAQAVSPPEMPRASGSPASEGLDLLICEGRFGRTCPTRKPDSEVDVGSDAALGALGADKPPRVQAGTLA